jgi:P pilus assembly chaperone PapD
MSTLGLRIEPSVVRVNDADSATVQITLDNQRGSALRIVLDGHDPDGAIQFTFSPPMVDLSAGQVTAVFLRL